MLRAASFTCVVLCAASLTGCWEGISRQVLATVLSVHGQVVYGSKENDLHAVNPDSTFGAGCLIRTAADAEIDLILVPGVSVRVAPNSELKMEELKLVKDGNETEGGMRSRTARIRLNRGGLTAYFEYSEGARGQLTIVTERVTVDAKPDCLFRLQSDHTRTRLISVLGTVYSSRGDGQSSAIKQGFFREWPAENPEPIPAADEPRAQVEISEGLKAGQELRRLRDQHLPRRNRFPYNPSHK